MVCKLALSMAAMALAAFLGNIPVQAQEPDPAALAASSNNAFGINLLKQLDAAAPAGQNVFISPVSIAQALGLLYTGAAGRTKAETGKVLAVGTRSDSEFEGENLALLTGLHSAGPSLQLTIANATWAQSGQPLSESYVDTIGKYFLAEGKSVDFHNAEGAASTIDDWVSGKTGGRITQLVSAGAVHNASCVLTNAVYFKGAWKTKFNATSTQPADFTLEDGSVIQIPTMQRTGSIATLFDPQVTVVVLPYGGMPATSMIIALPAEGQSAQSLLNSLGPATLDGWLSEATSRSINLSMPKFHVEYGADLTNSLEGLGVKLAFTRDADFSPMGIPDIFVSGVIHKSAMDVDEEGTVAAGATGVIMRSLAMTVPKAVHVDRPFLCAIRDDSTGALLFLGLINHPRGSN